jgi:hypothetical protein
MGRRRWREAEPGRWVRSGDGAMKQAVSGATRGWHDEVDSGDEGM